MDISLKLTYKSGLVKNVSYDEVELRENGQDIGDTLGEEINIELTHPDLKSLQLTITV